MFDALMLTTREERGDGYETYAVLPSVMYPATIERILSLLDGGELPQELVENHAAVEVDPRGVARLYLADARAIPAQAWKWALQKREQFTAGGEIQARAMALEVARRWFTQALHVQRAGKAIRVHILRDEAYRL